LLIYKFHLLWKTFIFMKCGYLLPLAAPQRRDQLQVCGALASTNARALFRSMSDQWRFKAGGQDQNWRNAALLMRKCT
jgi:hypothetical protein